MFPILFHSGFVTVYSFGLFAAIAFLAGAFTFWDLARTQSVALDQTFDGLLIAVVAGLVGARMLFVAVHPALFWPNILHAANLLYHPGFVWWGAIAFGALALAIYYRSQNMLPGNMLDKAAVSAAIAQAIGLIGAFLGGTAYGAKTSLALGTAVVGLAGRRYPVQLFEAAAELVLFILCLRIATRPHKKGYVALLYVFLYAVARGLLEFLRGDSTYWFGVRVEWIFCALAIALCIVFVTKRRKSPVGQVSTVPANVSHVLKETPS